MHYILSFVRPSGVSQFIHSLTHLLTHSLTHSLIHSFIHSFIHPSILSFSVFSYSTGLMSPRHLSLSYANLLVSLYPSQYLKSFFFSDDFCQPHIPSELPVRGSRAPEYAKHINPSNSSLCYFTKADLSFRLFRHECRSLIMISASASLFCLNLCENYCNVELTFIKSD